MTQLLYHLPVHLEFWIERIESLQLVQDFSPHGRRQDLRSFCPHLRRKQTYPNALDLRTVTPETEKFFEVSRTIRDLSGNRAVNGDKTFTDRFENALVGGRLATLVMLRLQSVDRNHQAELGKGVPGRGKSAEGTGHQLEADAMLLPLGGWILG